MNGIIHLNDGSTIKYNADKVQYTEMGIFATASQGKIFVPMSSIKFIAEKLITKGVNTKL